ncbi:MAG TPA: hypothetical protein VHN11_00470, partial [Xanthobacteraceae bacterium]|nr:hypothetical protein [Xanthobacteraceae bacterium]
MKRRRASQTGSLNHVRPQVKPERSPSPDPNGDRVLSDAPDQDTAAKIDRWLNSPELQPPR